MKKIMVWEPDLFKIHYESLIQNNEILKFSEKRRIEFYLRKLRLKNTDVVLDVGCGYGRLSKLISSDVMSVIGLDINPQNILYAKKYVGDKFQGHLVDLSLGILPFPERSIDKIVIDNVLMFFSREVQIAFFKEAKRVLKEQGVLVFNFENSDYFFTPISTFFTFFYKLKAQLQRKVVPNHYKSSFDFYEKILGELGFNCLESIGDTFYRKMGVSFLEIFPKFMHTYIAKLDSKYYCTTKKKRMSSLTIAASFS